MFRVRRKTIRPVVLEAPGSTEEYLRARSREYRSTGVDDLKMANANINERGTRDVIPWMGTRGIFKAVAID